jgi:hypothetical protein
MDLPSNFTKPSLLKSESVLIVVSVVIPATSPISRLVRITSIVLLSAFNPNFPSIQESFQPRAPLPISAQCQSVSVPTFQIVGKHFQQLDGKILIGCKQFKYSAL